ALADLGREDLASLRAGLPNLRRHVANLREAYGLRCVVALNHRTHDTDAEVALLSEEMAAQDTPVVVARHWAHGGEGALELAEAVVAAAEAPARPRLLYEDGQPLWEKLETVARRIYGAAGIMGDR